MQVNIHTDNTIEQHQGLDQRVDEVVRAAVGRFGEHITRVEVHLSNENSQKQAEGGNRCMMEARITGYQPVVVTNHDVNLHLAISGAGAKLQRAIDSALGRLHDKNLHESLPVEGEPEADKNLSSSS